MRTAVVCTPCGPLDLPIDGTPVRTGPRARALARRYGRAKRLIPRVAGTNPREMTPGAINSELTQIERKLDKVTTEMIAVGRGRETASETLAKDLATADDLTIAWRALVARKWDLQHEVSRRMGPGRYSNLPPGGGRGRRR